MNKSSHKQPKCLHKKTGFARKPEPDLDLEYSMYLSLQKSNLSEDAKKQFMRAFRENLELIRQLERLETK